LFSFPNTNFNPFHEQRPNFDGDTFLLKLI